MKQTVIMKAKDRLDRHRLLVSIVIVLVLLLVTWALLPMVFETNDDSSTMGYLAGAWTGKPEADTVFSLFLWGKIVSFFYIVNGEIPWYTMFFLCLIFLSLTAVCYCLTAVFPKCGRSMFCLLYFCMFFYYSVVLQFTVVSAFCGTAALAMMLTDKREECNRDFILKNVIICFFMFFAINIRAEVGYLTLASAAFAICMEVFRYLLKAADRCRLKRMAVSFLVFCAVAGISMGVHKVHESRGGWEEFREFNAERVQFIDYLALDYTSNRDLFDKIGWSEDFYNLVNRWFFMDETINTETFRMINERKTRVPMGVRWALTHDFPRIGFQAKMWVLLMLILLADAVRHRRGNIAGRAVPILWLFMWLAETWYFAHTGRLMERAFEAWTLLSAIPSVVEMGVSGNYQMPENEKRVSMANAALPVLMLLLCIICIWHPSGGYRRAKAISLAKGGEKMQSGVEDYAIAHMENVYIYDMSCASIIGGGVWRTYSEDRPYNLVFWGGSRYHSPLYYEQLERNGLEHLYEKDFFRKNVYMLAAKEPNEELVKVMKEKFPGCTYKITEERDEFIVYHFLIEECSGVDGG